MRDYRGRFDFNLTPEERAYYAGLHQRVELRRILTSPFGADGRPKDVTPEQSQWAMRVVRERPDWALPTLRELGFEEQQA